MVTLSSVILLTSSSLVASGEPLLDSLLDPVWSQPLTGQLLSSRTLLIPLSSRSLVQYSSMISKELSPPSSKGLMPNGSNLLLIPGDRTQCLGLPRPNKEAAMDHLNFPFGEADKDPAKEDHPVIDGLPLFLPLGPAQTFPNPGPLDHAHSFREVFPLFEVWKAAIAYIQLNNNGLSVTLGGLFFHIPGLALEEGVADPFESYVIEERLLAEPTILTPVDPMFQVGWDHFSLWSDTIWAELGANLEPGPAPAGAGASIRG